MLNRNSQIGLKIEATEGTEESLASSDFSGNRMDESHRYSPGAADRNLSRGTLTKQAQIKTDFSGGLSFTEEFVGGGASTNAPVHTTLRALGMKETALAKFTVGAVAGTFKYGEIVGNAATAGASTKFARFIVKVGSTVYLHPITGTFVNTDALHGHTSAANTSMTSDGSAAGFGFNMQTETDTVLPDSVTGERRLGGQRHTYVGMRGTGALSLRHKEPAKLQAELTGVPVFDDPATMTPRLGSLLTDIPAVGGVPKAVRGVPLRLTPAGGSAYTPVATELVFTFGNQIALRPTIADNSLGGNYESAYMSARIGDRDPSASLDPEHILAAGGIDFIGLLNIGTTVEIEAQVGAVTDTNGLLAVYAPAAQLRGDHEPGDRDGITTAPLQLGLTGDQDDEFWVWHAFA